MKRLIFALLLFFSADALAGYSESQFTSLTVANGGIVNFWKPGTANRYYAIIKDPPTRRLKIYIPPGAKRNFDLFGHVGQGQMLETFFIARAGQPPESTRPPDGTVFPDGGFTIAQLNQDCYGTNSSGYLIIAKDYIHTILTTGIWIYVDIYHVEGGLLDVQGSVDVDQAAYTAWYNSALFGKDGDPSPSGALPSPKPTPTKTPPVPTPTGSQECDPFVCATAGGRCVDNKCVYPSPTPTLKPTPKPTTTPTVSCNELFCFLSGGKCVGNVCVLNTPTPTPVPDAYQGSVAGTPLKIELIHATETTGMTRITVGDKTASDIPYKVWEHDNLKTVYVLGIGYLEITGNSMKINIYSGTTLEKKQ